MLIWLSSYVTWSTSETVAFVQLPLNSVFFCLAEEISHVIFVTWRQLLYRLIPRHLSLWQLEGITSPCCLLFASHDLLPSSFYSEMRDAVEAGLWIVNLCMCCVCRKRIASSGGRLYTWRTRWGHGTSIRLVLRPAQHGFDFSSWQNDFGQLLRFSGYLSTFLLSNQRAAIWHHLYWHVSKQPVIICLLD